MIKYNHDEALHNLKDANIIVPEIIKILNPKSVVDVGCGLGTFLYAFKHIGGCEVLGVDGSWVDKEVLKKYISINEFMEADLEKPFEIDKKFDLVVSLEVAEHLKKESANEFVKNLVTLGDVILFSAAIPNQGGQNHVNEQWPSYWEEKFSQHGYVFHDIIRPKFWDNSELFWWYKQNMFLVASSKVDLSLLDHTERMKNIVHYELFQTKVKEIQEKSLKLQRITTGEEKPLQYLKWLLFSIFGVEVFRKIRKK